MFHPLKKCSNHVLIHAHHVEPANFHLSSIDMHFIIDIDKIINYASKKNDVGA